MEESDNWHREKESDDSLRGKRPCKTVGCLPWGDEKLIKISKERGCFGQMSTIVWGTSRARRENGDQFGEIKQGEGTSKREKSTHWVNKGTEIYKYRVKSDDAHGLQWIAVDDVTCDHGIADLNSSGT